MKAERLSIEISESIGKVSAEIIAMDSMNFLYVFAHGAGAGMNHPFMVNLAKALAELGIGTLRYNFPYMEKGSRRPDPPAIAEKTVNSTIAAAHARHPSVQLLAGGKSFGGRMTSQALSKTIHPFVRGVIFTGFPLHAPGTQGTERAAHLASVSIPMLFLQGTRDALASMPLMEEVCASLPMATLKKFEGADHSFKAGKENLIPSLAAAISEWSLGVQP